MLWLLFCCSLVSPVTHTSPNIILILLDDAGYGDFGEIHVPTPNINSIARGGVNFVNGYVTAPQCSPSRAALLTGRYQQHYGHETNTEFLAALSHPAARLIPEYLPPTYHSGLFGKWNLGDIPHPPERHGFHHSLLYRHFDEIFATNTSVMLDGHLVRGREYSTSLMFQSANQFIRNKTRHHQPFFLYLSPMSPHVPHVFPPSYANTFHNINSTLPMIRRKVLTMMTELDHGVGTLLLTLEQLNIRNDTLIFLINDNGAPFIPHSPINPNRPLRGFKGELYEGGIHVQYSLQWPSVVTPQQVIHTPVSTLDVIPTLLQIFGLSSEKLEGRSLLPLLLFDDPMPQLAQSSLSLPPRTLCWRFLMLCKPEKRAMLRGEMKWLRIAETVELYNVSSDPFETVNLVRSLPAVAEEMENLYSAWELKFPPIPGREESKHHCPSATRSSP